MSTPLILVDRQPAITILTLNRAEKRNALNIALLKELCHQIAETEKLSDQRIMIITGAGSAFCAGLDLIEAADPALIESSAALLATLFSTIYNSRLVSIAAIQGAAIAGGAGIATACDLSVAAKEAEFGYPEVRRGLVAAQVSVLLCRRLPLSQVRELLFLGENITAKRAEQIGLINRAVPSSKLMSTVFEMAGKILKGTPQAIIETKHLLIDQELISLADSLNIALTAHRRARLSDEAKNRIETFFKK